MVEKASSLSLSFPFCQFIILHNLVAVLIRAYGPVSRCEVHLLHFVPGDCRLDGKMGGLRIMNTVDLAPFLRQKVQEWKRAQQKDPELKSLEQVGREFLDLQVRDCQHSARIAAKISMKLEGLGKKNSVESYINQMSQEERKYVSLISLLEEFTYKGD
jgi:hypothetical protein